ncbi:acyl-CoA dehydrogenase family protein [Pseudohaliea sp.]|uniref:acyl-CoA dehydrogenase family protein n=1 Tax=Pseudohaliea sp. TaxID=2740289 RepID=UPI0032ECBDE5
MSAFDTEVYRKQARDWLEEYAPAFSKAATGERTADEDFALGQKWQKTKFKAGYGAITFPKEYGGSEGHVVEKLIFAEEELRFDTPQYFNTSLGMPVPMLIRYGTEEQKRALVTPALRGDQLWCQLFSEPNAGSDLAALRMRARREGDSWILSGQKLWTTWAQYADYGIVLVRHDDSLPKHKGLTMFFVDMRAPGITVRPVRPLHGQTSINEVFFDDVRVPDIQRMGEVGAGFRVALETLMIERYTVSDVSGYGPSVRDFMQLARSVTCGGVSALENPAARQVIVDTLVQDVGLNEIHARALQSIAEGKEPGPEGSIRKLVVSGKRQRLAAAAMDLMGADGVAIDPAAEMNESFQASWIRAPAGRVAGGTDEILKNTIAERVLGLPQDYRPDKGVPYRELEG